MPASTDHTISDALKRYAGMSAYVAPLGRYSHATIVAMSEHAKPGNTVGRAKLPSSTSAVKMAPPSGTL